MNAWPTTEEVLATFKASDRLALNRWLDDHDANVRAEALLAARDEINRTRNVASLMTLADKFGGYYQGQRVGLEIAEGIVSRIERGEAS